MPTCAAYLQRLPVCLWSGILESQNSSGCKLDLGLIDDDTSGSIDGDLLVVIGDRQHLSLLGRLLLCSVISLVLSITLPLELSNVRCVQERSRTHVHNVFRQLFSLLLHHLDLAESVELLAGSGVVPALDLALVDALLLDFVRNILLPRGAW